MDPQLQLMTSSRDIMEDPSQYERLMKKLA